MRLASLMAGCFLAAQSVLAGPVYAAVYECKTRPTTDAGWISSKVMFEIQENPLTVFVYDGYIAKYHGDVLQAKVIERTDKKITFEWDVKDINLSNRNQRVTATYVATYSFIDKALRMRVYLRGGMDMPPPKGVGPCKPYKSKS